MDLPLGQSAFLWGPRKSGKSTYLHLHFKQSIFYDLLLSDLSLRLAKTPSLLREEVLSLSPEQLLHPIIIDEVQKIPALLDEIHWLIENTSAYFILCGSSARKLKRGAANLLGGRAWRFTFYPLVYPEISNFNLLQALNTGLIPTHYNATHAHRSLNAYVHDYIREEIQAESLVRNIPAFARFLDAIPFCHGELLNYSSIARDCAIDSKTVKAYFQILVDTLLGYYLEPFTGRSHRQLISATPKFYLFDVGLANTLAKREIKELRGDEAGRAFEHFIFTELIAYRGLKERNFYLHFWRTQNGFEVDFVINKGDIAIEVKISSQVRKSDLKGLFAFAKEYTPKKNMVVSLDPQRRTLIEDDIVIDIIPWKIFLKDLWAGSLF